MKTDVRYKSQTMALKRSRTTNPDENPYNGFHFDEHQCADHGPDECIVCYERFGNGREAFRLPKCPPRKHSMCQSCLENYLNVHATPAPPAAALPGRVVRTCGIEDQRTRTCSCPCPWRCSDSMVMGLMNGKWELTKERELNAFQNQPSKYFSLVTYDRLIVILKNFCNFCFMVSRIMIDKLTCITKNMNILFLSSLSIKK